MLKLSIGSIIERINKGEIFSAISEDNSFSIEVEEYVPYLCLAIHNGGNLRSTLRDNILFSKYERWQQEDVFTGNLISSLPIRVVCYDSKFEYNLNLPFEDCVQNKFKNKDIWKNQLTEDQLNISKLKYQNFFLVIENLIKFLSKKFKGVLVHDIHSFNLDCSETYPLFNIGVSTKSYKKFEAIVNRWRDELAKIEFPHIENAPEINSSSFKLGNVPSKVTNMGSNVLVLSTHLKKVYCDPESGDEYPEILNQTKEALKLAIVAHASFFVEEKTNLKIKKKAHLLSSKIDPVLLDLDKKLYSLVKDIEHLDFINPININKERTKFLKSKYRKNPEFKYKPLNIDADEIEKELLNLPINEITDIGIQNLYRSVIQNQVDQIEMLKNRDTENFLYTALKVYGRPNEDDVNNALFILHCKEIDEAIEEEDINAEQLKVLGLKEIADYGFKGKVELVNNLASKASFSSSRKSMKVAKDLDIKSGFAHALISHEIGVHMLTTINSLKQKLKIVRIGLPRCIETQEGLAVLSEYCSGHFKFKRLRDLALRTLAIEHMIQTQNFKETFLYLIETFGMSREASFNLSMRVYRAGGFTKDYLYLKGLGKIFKYYQEKDLTNLLIGKTSLEFQSIINELIEREILLRPTYITKAFQKASSPKNDIIPYLISCLK